MENLTSFYQNKKILVTGVTGFKGSWLCKWLLKLKAKVYGTGYSPNKNKKLFYSLNLQKKINLKLFDIRDFDKLNNFIKKNKPEIIFHLAAQPLVYDSYQRPMYTFDVNFKGTLNVLEAAKKCDSVKSIVCITTDKVYENTNKNKNFKETDRLFGKDPYSLSKASAELVIKSYREIYKTLKKNCYISSARAGNVIGGGDWSDNRLVPDCIKSIRANQTIIVRNPNYIRPWQHVLEPLKGYLLLAKNQVKNPKKFSSDWNFGPETNNKITVMKVVKLIINFWGKGKFKIKQKIKFKEHKNLTLNINKAKKTLKWRASFSSKEGIHNTIKWYYDVVNKKKSPSKATIDQIDQYMKKSKLR